MRNPQTSVMDTIFDTLPSGLILLNPITQDLQLNRKARAILGLPELTKIPNLDALPDYLQPIVGILRNGDEDILRSEVLLTLPSREEESTVGFSLKNILTEDASGQPSRLVTFTFSDITQVMKDRLAMDKIRDELNQSKKLASIGTMIAGVAHELNNPLTGISMSTELARMTLERLRKKLDPQADQATIETIDKTLGEIQKTTKAAQKAATLVSDLLSYSKPTQLSLTPMSITGLLDDIVQALKSHPEFSQVVFAIRPHRERTVLCDRIKLEQVFYNLFKNASEAMDHKGSITLFYSEKVGAEGIPQIVVHVRDTGPGIDKTIITRIFDPFFTTKGHSGVGLGLSISYRTVEQHGGLLSVESVKWEGTEFKVALPICLDEEDQE